MHGLRGALAYGEKSPLCTAQRDGHRAPTPKLEVPYTVVLADMDDGFRLMARLKADTPQGAAVGMAVRVDFEGDTGERRPCFGIVA